MYNYVASPYAWDFEASGGGLSFRKRSVMMNICSIYKQLENAQDIFAYKGIKALGYSMPPFEKGVEYFCESALYEDPIGSHQWWTFFCIAEQEDDYVYNQYMRLEL